MNTPAITAVIVGILPLLAAEEIKPPELTFEPLSLTISKFKRDGFGKGVNPFRMDMNAVSGVNLTARVTTDAEWVERIVPDACKLKRFTDDRQTNLLDANEDKGKTFWEDNRPFSVTPARDKDGFGVTIRGTGIPAQGSQKFLLEGELVFAPEGSEKEARRDGFELKHNDFVELDAVRLRFSQRQARPEFPDNKAGQETWYVQVLPREGVSNVKLLLFGKDKDVPIMGGPGSYNSTISSGPKKQEGDDPFLGITMQGFVCPGGKLSRILVRYVPTENLVKVPFKWETGFSLDGSSTAPIQ